MKKSQMARIVTFDREVRDKQYPSRSSFSTYHAISERTLARDIEFLRDRLEAPLSYDPVRRGYYYSKEWDIPAVVRIPVIQDESRVAYLVEPVAKLETAECRQVLDAVSRRLSSAKGGGASRPGGCRRHRRVAT